MPTVLTDRAREWQQNNPGRHLVHWEDFVFKGDFYHKGVDLSAAEVQSIMAQQVFGDAEQWARNWNSDPDNDMFRFAGIEFIGPVDGEWWEDKGKNPNPPRGNGQRYHKFGGNGSAHILTYP